MSLRRVASLLSVATAAMMLLACAAPAISASAQELQAGQAYNNTLALHLLRLAGAAYCPEATVQSWNCRSVARSSSRRSPRFKSTALHSFAHSSSAACL